MIRLEKERNLIKIYVEGSNGHYTFNVDTCQMLGKKGSPLKQTPLSYEMRVAFRQGNTNLYSIIRYMLEYEGCATYKYDRYVKAMHGAEKIDALGIGNFKASRDTYSFIEDNFPMFSKYYKLATDEGTMIDSSWFNQFPEYVRWEKARKQLGNFTEIIDRRMYDEMTNYGRREYTTEEWGVIAYYLVRGKMWEYTGGRVDKLIDYLNKCRYMSKTPEKVNNFMREWCETERGYQLRKAEYDTAKMLDNYNMHKKAFEFAFGDYVVVLPSVPQDIIKEGEDMHHCVGGYMQRVVDGRDYIVFVRHKDTPNKCYITCEVYTDGRIGQYFLAYDRYIHTAEDKAFYEAFAKHLAENW
jgi:hypothetical protein